MPISSALYYPHFTPSKDHLRGLLMFYDNLHLMVPMDDQWHVSDRGHVAEILETSKQFGCSDPIVFQPPEPHIALWSRRPGNSNDGQDIEGAAFKRLLSQCSKRVRKQKSFDNLEFEDSYWGYPVLKDTAQNQELVEILSSRTRNPWRFISAQKMSVGLLQELTDRRVALPVRYAKHPEFDQPLEMQPVLMVGDLVDFIISRLARDISFENDLFSVTYSGKSYLDHIFAPTQKKQERSSIFLSFAVPTLVPKNIGNLNVGDYFEIRESFALLRETLGDFARELVNQHYLDDDLTRSEFTRKLDHSMNELDAALSAQSKQLGRSKVIRTTRTLLEVGGSVVGAGVGSMLGDLYGAAAGTIVGQSIASFASGFSSSNQSKGAKFLSNTAMMHATVDRKASRPTLAVPNYWI